MFQSKSMSWILYLIGLIFFISLLFFSTPNGLGMSPDSIAYLKAAKDYVYGHGLISFTSQWPPLYPLLIVMISQVTGGDIFLASRILNTLIFALNFSLLIICIKSYTQITYIFSIFISGVLCLQGVITYVHFYAWSESTFILVILLDLLLLKKITSFQKNNINWIAFGTIIFLGTVAVCVRYIGYTVAVTNALVIFSQLNIKISKRFFLSVSNLLIPIAFITPWLLHRSSFQSLNTDRTFTFNGISFDTINEGLHNLTGWFYPQKLFSDYYINNALSFILFSTLMFILVFLPLLYLIGITFFNYKIKPIRIYLLKQSEQIYPVLIFISVYILSIIFFISFVDKKIPLDNRILSPIFLPVFIFVVYFLSNGKNIYIRIISMGCLLLSLSLAYSELKTRILVSYFDGIELASKKHINKPINIFITTCFKNSIIGADYPWHYDLYFDSKIQWLPRQVLFGSGLKNPNYKIEIAQLIKDLNVIIIEDKLSDLVNEINSIPQFHLVYKNDGYVWINTKLTSELKCNFIN